MKRTFLLLLLFIVLSISGCGASQEDIDELLEENSSLQDQVESLQLKNEELLEEQTEQVLSETSDSFTSTWATSSFGENTICMSDGNSYFQCIAGKPYTISVEGISELYSDFLKSVKLLSSGKDLAYETISVKFLDHSGVCILDMTLKKLNGSYSTDSISIMCNINHLEPILSGLLNSPK